MMRAALNSLVVVGVLLSQRPAEAQSRAPIFHRLAQINAIAAPTADVVTTLHTNQWANLVETNPLLRRANGTADPTRTIALKAGYTTLNLYLLRLARHEDLRESPWLRWATYASVIALNGLEWRAAWNNAHLPRTARWQ